MNESTLQGIYPAILTPCNCHGNVMTNELKPLIDWQLQQGVMGFYIDGATGECYGMAVSERKRLVKAALDAIDQRVTGIVHVGAPTQQDAIGLAHWAMENGANVLSATPPPVYRYSAKEIAAYYRAIIQATDLPFVIYGNALFTSEQLLYVLEELSDLPNLQGIKFTRTDYYELYQIRQLKGKSFSILNGPDQTLLCGLAMGAHGGIGSTYNVMPRHYVQLYHAWKQGDIAKAQQLQEFIDRMIPILVRYGQINTMKWLLSRAGFPLGHALEPAALLGAEEKSWVLQQLKNAGFFLQYPEFQGEELEKGASVDR